MTSTPPTASDQRATVVAGFLGWTLDAFDFFLVVMTLTAIAKEFGKSDAAIALSITLTLAFRPVGGRRSCFAPAGFPRGVPAGGSFFPPRVPPGGRAPAFLHGGPPRAAGAVRARGRKGIGGGARAPPRELERFGPDDHLELEA